MTYLGLQNEQQLGGGGAVTEGAVRTGAITTTGALITSLLSGILSYTSCIIALKIHINFSLG